MCTPCNTWFLGPTWDHIPNGISIGSAIFAQLTAKSPYTLKMGCSFPPLKIAHSHGRTWTPSNRWLLRSTRVHSPNGISIGSAIFARLTVVTDRLTDWPRYSVRNNRPHLWSTAMRPNNYTKLAAMLHGSRPGCNPRATKPLKIQGVAQPLYSRGHN